MWHNIDAFIAPHNIGELIAFIIVSALIGWAFAELSARRQR